MRIVMPFVPVYNHRLGPGYLTALLRRAGHEVILLDLEHVLRVSAGALSLRLSEETEVYAENWAEQIQFLHRPELLFGALWPEDREVRLSLSDQDRSLIEDLRPHVTLWADSIVAFEPDLLLLPALVSNLWMALWLGEVVKRSAPGIPRVFGGRGLSYRETRELILRAGWAEAILPGEAEASVSLLADKVASGQPPNSWSIPGLVRLAGDDVLEIPAAAPPALDNLPFPDFAGLPFPGASLRHYSESGRDFHEAASLAGSRWCARHCAYCYESIYPKNYRLRGVQGLLNEIEFQREKLETPGLFFCDSTMNLSPRWLEELVDGMLRSPVQPRVVFAHCEPRRLHKGLLDKMRAAGFAKLNFGVETLDAQLLQAMDRDLTVEETEQTLLDVIESGISLGVNFVSNYPFETAAQYENTLARARRLSERLRKAAGHGAGARLMVSQARVDPHSSLFVNRARFGIRIHPRPLPAPEPLRHLQPCIDSIALRWDDGLSRAERQERFVLMRTYLEGLSIEPIHKAAENTTDRRIALDPRAIPAPLLPLLNSFFAEGVHV